LMILICVFLSVPILPTSIASDYGISPLLPRFVSNYSRSPSELMKARASRVELFEEAIRAGAKAERAALPEEFNSATRAAKGISPSEAAISAFRSLSSRNELTNGRFSESQSSSWNNRRSRRNAFACKGKICNSIFFSRCKAAKSQIQVILGIKL
jgi:hypothetical protein